MKFPWKVLMTHPYQRGAKRIFLIVVCLFILHGLASPQSWNRAVFRGDETEPRDFTFNDEYFLNLLSYREWPDWQDRWSGSEIGYRLTVGSVRSDKFYLHQEAKLHLGVTEHFWFHYNFLEHEDFDTRYLRQRPALRAKGACLAAQE